jgi:hypothetical protein
MTMYRRWESLGGSRLICQSDFHLGSMGTVLASHDLLYPELQSKKKQQTYTKAGVSVPMPPPPPRARKGSSFPLQTFGSRLYKLNPPLVPPPTRQAVQQPTVDKKTCVLVATVYGGIGLLVPLDEKMYKRLALLQEIMSRTIVTVFALNPKDYRAPRLPVMGIRYPDSQSTFMFPLVSAAGDALTAVQQQASFGHNKQMMLDGVLLQRFLCLPRTLQEQLASVLGVTAYLIRENLHEIDYLSRFF